MDKLADEFLISKTQGDSSAVETVVLAVCHRPAVGEATVDSTMKLLGSLFFADLFVTAELSESSSVNSLVSKGYTPVFLKLAVMFAEVNERSKASLIIPGRLCIEIVFPGLLSSQLSCLCHFYFEWPHHFYIWWLESVSAVSWEGAKDNAILSTIQYCINCAVVCMIVEKYQDGLFFATASIFLDVLQHF